jgi:hypothetical protein
VVLEGGEVLIVAEVVVWEGVEVLWLVEGEGEKM